jgi:hypothetical protein
LLQTFSSLLLKKEEFQPLFGKKDTDAQSTFALRRVSQTRRQAKQQPILKATRTTDTHTYEASQSMPPAKATSLDNASNDCI